MSEGLRPGEEQFANQEAGAPALTPEEIDKLADFAEATDGDGNDTEDLPDSDSEPRTLN